MSGVIEILNDENVGLAWNFGVNPDSCNNPEHYENFIRFSALSDQKYGRGTTHLLIDEEERKLMGFITLRASSLIKIYSHMKEGHSALEISEIAVDKEFERIGVGTVLVNFAIALASRFNESALGIEYITLCSDPSALDFYLNKKRFGFGKLEDYHELPRDGWNNDCIPLFLKLHTN